MGLVMFIVLIALVAFVMLTDKTSPFYNSALATGTSTSNLTPNNSLYEQYRTESVARTHASLLVTAYNKLDKAKADRLQIYRESSGSLVLVDHKNKLASRSDFVFDAFKLDNDTYTYRPAETTYTGVSVGGFHVGGTHTEAAHYEHSTRFSGNGCIACNYAKNLPFFLVWQVELNGNIYNKSIADPFIKQFVTPDKMLRCSNIGHTSVNLSSVLGSSNIYENMNSYSRAVTGQALPLEDCKRIARWLTQAVKTRT